MVFVAVLVERGVPVLVTSSPPLDFDLIPGSRDWSFGTAVSPNPKIGTGSLLKLGRTYIPRGPESVPIGMNLSAPNRMPTFLSPRMAGIAGLSAR